MALKTYGSFIAELTKTSNSNLDCILLYGDGIPCAYFMTPITYLNKSHKELEARFNINNQNIAIETGQYSLKLILNDNGNFSHVCLLKKSSNFYDITFFVAVNSIIASADDKIKVRFTALKIDVEQTVTSSSIVH